MTPRQPLYILDTNVVSELKRPRPNPEVLDWIGRQAPRSLAIAYSTVFEIQYGAELARGQSPGKASSLEDWLDRFVLSGKFRILRPCPLSVRIRARMHATPALRGFLEARPGAHKPPSGEKLTIAAQAIAAAAVVVTMNDRDFARINECFPLPGVLNPCSGEWAVALEPRVPLFSSTKPRALGIGSRSLTLPRRHRATPWDHGFTRSKPWTTLRGMIARENNGFQAGAGQICDKSCPPPTPLQSRRHENDTLNPGEGLTDSDRFDLVRRFDGSSRPPRTCRGGAARETGAEQFRPTPTRTTHRASQPKEQVE